MMIQSLLGPSLLSLPSWLLQNTLSRANSPQEAGFLGEQQCLTELHDCTSVQAWHGSLLSSCRLRGTLTRDLLPKPPSYITGCSGLKQMSVFVPIPELLWLRGGKPWEMASFRHPGLFIAVPTAVTFPRFFLDDYESMFSLEIPGNTKSQTSQVLPVFVLPTALLLAWPRNVSTHPHPSACQCLPVPASACLLYWDHFIQSFFLRFSFCFSSAEDWTHSFSWLASTPPVTPYFHVLTPSCENMITSIILSQIWTKL